MTHYLVFQLYAPLVSWGEPAVGEVRHTSPIPSRSALLGLLAAALGIRRDEEERLVQFNQHYRFAVRPLSGCEGWLRDYHTVQMPKEDRKRIRRTRRDELLPDAGQSLETMLTTREYRCDAYYHIAVSETPDEPYSLHQLADALREPVFTLYLGRKSCPLALPLAPHLFSGTLADVWQQASNTTLLNDEDLQRLNHPTGLCYWEQDADSGMPVLSRVLRGDQPLSRRRWQFTTRRQYSGTWRGGK
ncbi:type I-E CRISPR-associated protein Cas5/CasD [Prodigiosinella aquatilis]|nr:type I-E CRISPR-associated protein Cas5/CasD [Prodigiosinella sp. LS101]WJV53501.1 type I-E CRISPR-associated protein Cas5/CasD [Prodigiosinella sp. LS101]WJV57862.1 type I-E CRISPR-associated protein Cas5/CasD [Pectobacteriaceae bacterium C111]